MVLKKYLLLNVIAASVLQAQIQVIESNSTSLKLNWNIATLDTQTVSNNISSAVLLSFDGQNTILGKNGEVALPGYSLFTGVPQSGDVNVTIEPLQLKTIQLSSKPVMQNSDMDVNLAAIEFVNPYISKPIYGTIKGIRTANVVIRPGIYDENSNSIRVLTQATITIQFPPNNLLQPATVSSSDGERLVASLLCNYSIAKGWRVMPKLSKTIASQYPVELSRSAYHFKIGDGHTDYNEGTINENGLMKITGTEILSRFGTTATSQVRLFASYKGELPDEAPTSTTIPSGVVEIPLLRVDKGTKGMVDSTDYFVAYVTGASDWVFRDGQYKMVIDRQDDYRHYWLTTGGIGASVDSYTSENAESKAQDVSMYPLFIKQSKEQVGDNEGGMKWRWELLNYTKDLKPNILLPELASNLPGYIKFDFRTYNNAKLNVSYGNHNWTDCNPYDVYTISKWGDKKIRFGVSGTIGDSVEFKSFTLNYPHKIDLSHDSAMTIFSLADSGFFSYILHGVDSEKVFIFRITNNDNSIMLIDNIKIEPGKSYVWSDSGQNGARYLVYKESALMKLPVHEEYSEKASAPHCVHDLRNVNNTSDYLIITHPDFIPAAETLAVHKAKVGFKNPVVVDVADIYRLFSGGNTDPVAIRNFVSYVRAMWRNGADLDYLLLMGSAHYDIKMFSAKYPSYVPTYYHDDTMVYDDFMATSFNDNERSYLSSIAIGRIPCKTISEAFAVIDKIKEFEDTTVADMGEWRNRALFVADDDMQGSEKDGISNNSVFDDHYISSDKASNSLTSRWKSLDLRKVFLYEYVVDNRGDKPGATQAIINEINSGVAFVNYFGHGAIDLWADEHILKIDMLQQMVNRMRYPLISSFSCSVGKFDQPIPECLSAALIKAAHSGAIATISSSRSSSSTSNTTLAENFYSQLTDSNIVPQSVGMMLNKAKILSKDAENHKYILMGDPSLKFVNSIKRVKLEMYDKDNNDLKNLKALQLVKVHGSILNSDSSFDASFGTSRKAYVNIGLFNPPDSSSRKDQRDTTTRKYQLPGATLFQGKVLVVNGLFDQTILLPKKVTFNKPGTKLIAYAWQENSRNVGTGYRNDFVFNGSDTSSSNDSTGPVITIRPIFENDNMNRATATFSDKIISSLPLKCEVNLYDPSGIDVIGTGPDEGLTIEIPGVLSKQNINHKFQFKVGDYRNGVATIEFDEQNLKKGDYTLNISARDMSGYLSERSFAIEITDEQSLTLNHVFNFPNPVRAGQTTRFYFYPSNTSFQDKNNKIRIVLKIYSLNGKLIRVIKDASNGVIWDCKDQKGVTLSPDIYLYQVSALQRNKLVKSKIGKVVIHPPR